MKSKRAISLLLVFIMLFSSFVSIYAEEPEGTVTEDPSEPVEKGINLEDVNGYIEGYEGGKEYKLKNSIGKITIVVPKTKLSKDNPKVIYNLNVDPEGAIEPEKKKVDITDKDENKVGSIELEDDKIIYSLEEGIEAATVQGFSFTYNIKSENSISFSVFEDVSRKVTFSLYDFDIEEGLTIGDINKDGNSKEQLFTITKKENRKFEIEKVVVSDVNANINYNDQKIEKGTVLYYADNSDALSSGRAFTFKLVEGETGTVKVKITDIVGNEKTVTLNLGHKEPVPVDPTKFEVTQSMKLIEEKEGENSSYYIEKIIKLTGGDQTKLPESITIDSDIITLPKDISEGNQFVFDTTDENGIKYDKTETGYKLVNPIKLQKKEITKENEDKEYIYTYRIKINKKPDLSEYRGKAVESNINISYEVTKEGEGVPTNIKKDDIKGKLTFGDAFINKIHVNTRLSDGEKITTWAIVVNNSKKPIGLTKLTDDFKSGTLVEESLKYAKANKNENIDSKNIESKLKELNLTTLDKKGPSDVKSPVPFYTLEGNKFEIFFGDRETEITDGDLEGAVAINKIFKDYVVHKDVTEYSLLYGLDHYPDYSKVVSIDPHPPFTSLANDYGKAIRTKVASKTSEGFYEFQKPTSGVPLVITYELIEDNAVTEKKNNDVNAEYYETLPSFDIEEPMIGGPGAVPKLIPKEGKLIEEKTKEEEDKNKIYKQEKASVLDENDSTIVHHGILANTEGVSVDEITIVDDFSQFAGIYNEKNIKLYKIDNAKLKELIGNIQEVEGNEKLTETQIFKILIKENMKKKDGNIINQDKNFTEVENINHSIEGKKLTLEIANGDDDKDKSYLLLLDTYVSGKIGDKTNNATVSYDNGTNYPVNDKIKITTKLKKEHNGTDTQAVKKYKLSLDLEEFKIPTDINEFIIEDRVNIIYKDNMIYENIEKVNANDNFTITTQIDENNKATFVIKKNIQKEPFPNKLEFTYDIRFNIGKIFGNTVGTKTVNNTINLYMKYTEPEREITETVNLTKYLVKNNAIASYPTFNVEINKEVEGNDSKEGFIFGLKGENNTPLSTNEEGKVKFMMNYFGKDYTISETKKGNYVPVDDIKFNATTEGIKFNSGVLKKGIVEVLGIKDKNNDFVDGKKYPENDPMRISGTYSLKDEETIVLKIVNKKEKPTTPTDPGIPIDPSPEEPVKPIKPIPELNKEDHFGYMIGYPDGLFKPEEKITRAEVTTIFFRMLTENSRNEMWNTKNNFKDIKNTDWHNNAVSTMANGNIVKGYEDGTFRPNAKMTRAEFTVLLTRFFADTETVENKFTDIKGHWAEKEIGKVVAKGWIKGYTDGTFKPDQPITRAEAAKLVNAILERTPDIKHLLDNMIVWPDNSDKDKWYYVDVQEATNSHAFERKDNKSPETWTKLLPIRDWAALEKEWSKVNSSVNPGEIVK